MGYRFVLRRLEYPRTVRAGQMMALHMWWFNAGVAPVYRDYTLALKFYSANNSEQIPLSTDVKKWLPGDAVFDGSAHVPGTLRSGTYRLRLALLDPRTQRPAIRLAIKGLGPDGWYDLGPIMIAGDTK